MRPGGLSSKDPAVLGRRSCSLIARQSWGPGLTCLNAGFWLLDVYSQAPTSMLYRVAYNHKIPTYLADLGDFDPPREDLPRFGLRGLSEVSWIQFQRAEGFGDCGLLQLIG